MKLARQITKAESSLKDGLEKSRTCVVCGCKIKEVRGMAMNRSPNGDVVCEECAILWNIPQNEIVFVENRYTTSHDVVKAFYWLDGQKFIVLVELDKDDEQIGVFADAYLHRDGELFPLWRKGRGYDADFCLMTDRQKVVSACNDGNYELIDQLEKSFCWWKSKF